METVTIEGSDVGEDDESSASVKRRSVRALSLLCVRLDDNRWLLRGVVNVSADVFGVTRRERLGGPVSDLFNERSRSAIQETIDLFERDAPPRLYDRRPDTLWMVRDDGGEVPVRVTLARARGANRLMVLHDMSDPLRERREAAARMDALKASAAASDHDATLEAAASWAARAFGGYAVVETTRTAGAPRSVRVRCASPGTPERLRELKEGWKDGPLAALSRQVMTSGQPVLASGAGDLDELGLDELRVRGLAAVPLTAETGVTGTLSVLSARQLTEADLSFLRELGRVWGERIAVAQRLRAAESSARRRADQMRIVAHELRNASGAVTMLTSSLVKQRALDGVLDASEALAASASRLDRLVADLWKAGRSDERGLDVRPVPGVAAGALVLGAVHAARVGVPCGRVQPSIAPGLPPVRADADRVRQVLANLIENALKFSPASSTVIVGARPGARGDRVAFFVRDTGIGISPEHQARVFDPGFQAVRDDRRGWGLGLAICKRIVEAHGGEIEVESRPGAGSTFTFWLGSPPASGRSGRPGSRSWTAAPGTRRGASRGVVPR